MCVQIATMYMQDSDSDLLTKDRMKMDEAKFRETGTDRRTGGGGGGELYTQGEGSSRFSTDWEERTGFVKKEREERTRCAHGKAAEHGNPMQPQRHSVLSTRSNRRETHVHYG